MSSSGLPNFFLRYSTTSFGYATISFSPNLSLLCFSTSSSSLTSVGLVLNFYFLFSMVSLSSAMPEVDPNFFNLSCLIYIEYYILFKPLLLWCWFQGVRIWVFSTPTYLFNFFSYCFIVLSFEHFLPLSLLPFPPSFMVL